MQTLTNAEPCKRVQKEEWINTLLLEITANPKITNNDLAEKYQVPRNRISKYRNIIRQRQLKTNMEIVNKIDSVLEDRISDMEDRDLISYRKAVHQEVNITETINTSTTKTLNINVTEEDKTAILNAYKRLRIIEKESSTTQPPNLH